MDQAGGILLKFAIGLAKKAGAAVFQEKHGDTFIYKQVIGNEEMELSEISIEKIVKRVATVFKTELDKQFIEQHILQAQDFLKGVQAYFEETYPLLGGSDAAKDFELSIWEKDLRLHVLEPLQSERLSVEKRLTCLPAWLLAASMHLAILQERANLFPNEAGRKAIIVNHVKRYASAAETVYQQGLKQRLAHIREPTEVRRSLKSFRRVIGSVIGVKTYKFFDGLALDGAQQPVQDLTDDDDDNEEDAVYLHKWYLGHVSGSFDSVVGRWSMVAIFQVWATEFPTAITFSPTSYEAASRHTLQLDNVKIELPGDKDILFQPSTEFGYTAAMTEEKYKPSSSGALQVCSEEQRSLIVPMPSQLHDGRVLHFLQPVFLHSGSAFIAEASDGMRQSEGVAITGEFQLILYYRTGRKSDWKASWSSLFVTKATAILKLEDGRLTSKEGLDLKISGYYTEFSCRIGAFTWAHKGRVIGC